MNPVVFSFATWVAMFPIFGTLTQAQGQAYFNLACTICANNTSNPIYGDGNLQTALYFLTSHFAWLNCPKDANGNPAATASVGTSNSNPLVGRISNASEGSVSVQTEWNVGSDASQLEAFLTQTQWGTQYWAMIQQYRTSRYIARPTRVPLAGWGFRGFGLGFWR